MDIKKIVIITSFISIACAAYFVHKNYTSNYKDSSHVVQAAAEGQLPNQAEILQHQVALQPKPMIEVVSPENLRDILTNKKEPAILFFHMNGCGWCKKMDPVYQDVAKNPEFASIQFYSVNGKDCDAQVIVKELLDQQVQGFPTLIFMNEHGYADKQVGFAQQEDFEQKIRKIFFGQDEPIAPVVEKKEVQESGNVIIQSCVATVGNKCTGKAGSANGNCCGDSDGSNGEDMNCAACNSHSHGIVAADGATGYCQTSGDHDSYCGIGSTSNDASYGTCKGVAYNVVGGSNNVSSGTASGCAPSFMCASTSNKDAKTGLPYPAKNGESGSCYSCGTYGSSVTTANGYSSLTCSYNSEEIALICFNGQQCKGGSGLYVLGSGIDGNNSVAGACCDNFDCLTTNTGTDSAGSELVLAASGKSGQCFSYLGLTTTGAKTTVDGETVNVYDSSSASGDVGQAGNCSGSGEICAGADEGALGTCCQGGDYVMNCMVSDTKVASYGTLGTCMKAQQSGNLTVCTGTSSTQGTCQTGYACVYKNTTSSGTYIETVPNTWSGYCVLDNGEYGTQNQCSDLEDSCVGGSSSGPGTCCPNENLSCLINNESSTIYSSDYATKGQVGYCYDCSKNTCTGETLPQGSCCPSYTCNTSASSTEYAAVGASGTCVLSKDTTTCVAAGQSCNYMADTTLGTCCTGANLVCANGNTTSTTYGDAITTGSGTCMSE